MTKSDQSSQLDRADHLRVTQGGQGPHSRATRFCSESRVFDRYVQMQQIFDDVFALHDMMYMDCTNIYIYIHEMIVVILYVYGCMWCICMDLCDAYVWIYVMLMILTLVMQDVM